MKGITRQLRRLWKNYPLPTLKQGGTLTIRSQVPNVLVDIQPQWRDDGGLTFTQQFHPTYLRNGGKESNLSIQLEQDLHTSIGRAEAHVSVLLEHPEQRGAIETGHPPSELSTQTDAFEPLEEISTSSDSTSSSIAEKKDGPDGDGTGNGIVNDVQMMHQSDNSHDDDDDDEEEDYEHTYGPPPTQQDQINSVLTIQVPEKLNLDCSLDAGGTIQVQEKIEGDVNLKTSNGNITVKKLRGHIIQLEAMRQQQETSDNTSDTPPSNEAAIIHATGLLEAQKLIVNLPSTNSRLRAKRVHASSVQVEIGQNDKDDLRAPAQSAMMDLDNDDTGALCDISSMYLSSGQASIKVHSTHTDRRAARIKSNHGPVVVETSGMQPTMVDPMTGKIIPMVEINGVNGSCEVTMDVTGAEDPVEKGINDQDETSEGDWTACQIHMDSLSPDTVSLVHTNHGDVALTVDRKIEADMRLLSAHNADQLDLDDLLCEQSDDPQLVDALKALDNDAAEEQPRDSSNIDLQTKAFVVDDELRQENAFSNIQYVSGHIDNKSGEPDSRFDRKVKGGGKIRLDGAAAQALQRFGHMSSSSDDGKEADEFLRPLIAVATPGSIRVETLSWMGNIARRYGMDDDRQQGDLGRTATRRGRSFVEDG